MASPSSFRKNVSTAQARKAAARGGSALRAGDGGALETAEAPPAAAAADAEKTAAGGAARPAATLAPGERLSAHNGQPLVSTGVPSLDDLLGGGLPVGAVMLVLEDRRTAYSRLLLAYFLAQGLSLGHALCVTSADVPPELLLRGAPWLAGDPSAAPRSAGTPEEEEEEGEEPGECGREQNGEREKMTIAWRYQRLRQLGESDARPKSTGHVDRYSDEFDLTRRVPQETLDGATLHLIDATSWAEAEEQDPCARLLFDIARVIAKEARRSNVLRIAVHGLCSPAWPPAGRQQLFKFLHGLRALLRRSPPTACVLTIPAYTFEDDPIGESILRQALHCVDAAIRLRSFTGHPEIAHPSYASSYHGLVDVLKPLRMNGVLAPAACSPSRPGGSLASPGGAREDLAFRLRRRRFAFETFHLPPEGGGVGARSTPANKTPPAGVLKKSSSFASDGAGAGAAASPGETAAQGRAGFGPTSAATKKKKAVAFAGAAAGCGAGAGGPGDPLLDF